MANKIKTNKLTIYLVKEEFDTQESILKNLDELTSYDINGDETLVLYIKNSHVHPPDWIEKFFYENPDDFKLKSSSSQALLIAKVKVAEEKCRYFALSFGGYYLIKSEAIEERFGLKIVLNTVNENQLKSIDKKNMSSVPKQSREQISLSSVVSDFGIDIEQDLVFSVTGKSKYEEFGKTITGKDALNVSVKVDINTVNDFLIKCYDYYNKNDYKKNFGWIDQIAEIKNPAQVETLDQSLIGKIRKNDFNKLWMAIPEIIEWEDIEGFCYSYNIIEEKKDDIDLISFLDGLFPENDYAQATLAVFDQKVLGYTSSTDIPKYQWKAYKCLYCEIENNNLTYLLTNGKWYQIENNFVKQVNSQYRSLLQKECNISLPPCKDGEREDEYNQRVSENVKQFCLMDKKNIYYGGGYSKVEFCDLFSTEKRLIHVKHYGGSSVLSHLFNQGLVSGELFKAEKGFRDKVNEKLPSSHKLSDTSNIDSEYEVIYAVISCVDEELDIPFFSKVSLKNARRRLDALGYDVYLTKIEVENS